MATRTDADKFFLNARNWRVHMKVKGNMKKQPVATKFSHGNIYVHKDDPRDLYIYAQVDQDVHRMIGIEDGNRFIDRDEHPSDWVDVTKFCTFTYER